MNGVQGLVAVLLSSPVLSIGRCVSICACVNMSNEGNHLLARSSACMRETAHDGK